MPCAYRLDTVTTSNSVASTPALFPRLYIRVSGAMRLKTGSVALGVNLLCSIGECDMGSTDFVFADCNKSQLSWQFESLWSCRARVEQQRITEPFVLRLVGMTEDTNVRSSAIQKCSSFFRELSSFIDDMTNGDYTAGQLNRGLKGETTSFIPIDIAADGRHGSNRFKLFDDASPADITGVNNMIHAMEMAHDCRVEQAMRIGNHTDADCAGAVHGLAGAPREVWTLAHSNVKGAVCCFDIPASSTLRRSALALLIGWVESHSTRPPSFSANRWKKVIMPDGSILARWSI